MRMVRFLLVVSVLAAFAIASGCASRAKTKPTQQPADEGEAMVEDYEYQEPEETGGMKYVVKRGDTLWGISSMNRIYEDPFRWPLLYRANRDQIEDPDLIYPDQEFDIKTDWSRQEIADAVQKAKDTPPYRPHTSPRKRLPLRY